MERVAAAAQHWMWDRVLVTHSAPDDTASPGHTIEELASGSGRSPASVLLGLYEEYGNAVQVAEAVRKMTGEPADRCRLAGRGYLRPGYAADLVVFSAGEVEDRATFAASNQLPVGIDRVLVNGVEVVSGDAWNGATAGRVLRRGEAG